MSSEVTGRRIELATEDGFTLGAWLAEPAGEPRGALVILQEVFGVNSHIRAVTERYAGLGFLAVAPALFDRAERDVELGYAPEDVEAGRALMRAVSWPETVLDIEAAGRAVARAGTPGMVGYCWGGTAAWVTAARSDAFAYAVSYYGNAIVTVLEERPRIPVQMHWGERDHLIGIEDIRRVAEAAPEAETYVYPTGHGFNCDQRDLYHPESARRAQEHTLAFIGRHSRRGG